MSTMSHCKTNQTGLFEAGSVAQRRIEAWIGRMEIQQCPGKFIHAEESEEDGRKGQDKFIESSGSVREKQTGVDIRICYIYPISSSSNHHSLTFFVLSRKAGRVDEESEHPLLDPH